MSEQPCRLHMTGGLLSCADGGMAGLFSSPGRSSSAWRPAWSFRRRACRRPWLDRAKNLPSCSPQAGFWPLPAVPLCHNRPGGHWAFEWTDTASFARSPVHEMQKSKLARQSISLFRPHPKEFQRNIYVPAVQRPTETFSTRRWRALTATAKARSEKPGNIQGTALTSTAANAQRRPSGVMIAWRRRFRRRVVSNPPGRKYVCTITVKVH